MRPLNTIVIHCSASREGQDVKTASIRNYHVKTKKWRDIGYHYVIELDGKVVDGRPLGQIGAHVKGHNTGSVGICYVGGLDKNGKPKDTRTAAQKRSMRELIESLLEEYPAIRTIKGHRDFPGVAKACPCFDAIPEYQPLVDRVDAVCSQKEFELDVTADDVEEFTPEFQSKEQPAGKKWSSTTNWAAVGSLAATLVASLGDLDPILSVTIVVIAATFAWWIIKERNKKANELGV